ncbi:MAG: NERD domain-containing protein [Staphylococcus sp.]|nr:NERD domain-containing protein [Staphylococcus sp.]
MNSFGPVEIGLIAAIIIAIICFILFLVALKSKNNMKHKENEEYNLKEQQLKSSHEEALEKERIENKKQVTKQKEEFEVTVNGKEREIDALKLFSKNKSEYVTDMRLIGIRDRLVKEKRIRREDMHIMANIFLPSNEFNNIQRISHLVLTRTGLYIIDSQLLKGHVYNGISGAQFQELPMLKQVFDTLDLNTQAPQTLVLDQHEDNHSKLSFINYSDQLSAIEKLATDLQTELGLKYTPTSILYFNPKHDKDVTISNYAQSSSVKVLVGPEQLDEFFNKFVFHGRIQYNVDELQNIMDKIESFN